MPIESDRRSFLKKISALLGAASGLGLIPVIAGDGWRLKAEAALLLASLVQTAQFPRVQDGLSGHMFQDAFHAELFQWMSKRRRNGLPYDWAAAVDVCMNPAVPHFRDGLSRIWKLVDDRPEAPHAVECSAILRHLLKRLC